MGIVAFKANYIDMITICYQDRLQLLCSIVTHHGFAKKTKWLAKLLHERYICKIICHTDSFFLKVQGFKRLHFWECSTILFNRVVHASRTALLHEEVALPAGENI